MFNNYFHKRFNLYSILDVVMLVFFNQYSAFLSPANIFFINNIMRSELKIFAMSTSV